MANIGSVTLEIRPTVTLESACACVIMLNMFLTDNEDYRLEISRENGRWHLTDKPFVPAEGGIYSGVLSNIPNQGSPLMTDEEQAAWAEKLRKLAGLEVE